MLKSADAVYISICARHYGNMIDPLGFMDDFRNFMGRLTQGTASRADHEIEMQIVLDNFRPAGGIHKEKIFKDPAGNIYISPLECLDSIVNGSYNIPSEMGRLGLHG